jgi:hypothetical protein
VGRDQVKKHKLSSAKKAQKDLDKFWQIGGRLMSEVKDVPNAGPEKDTSRQVEKYFRFALGAVVAGMVLYLIVRYANVL